METALKKDMSHSNSSNDIQNAIKALQTEIEGLKALVGIIDENFSAAVEAIHAMKTSKNGRLIVAGIGKSGHVARKMSATLASTGTPAFFVHPGEASHGDMGMITPQDVVLMLSNSGETAELTDLIYYTKRFNITAIAMTSRAESTLAKHADIALVLPNVPEACPNGLAPTTSTTMMMALGDALAVALLARMNLTPEQFKIFHPGGKLGQQLLSVSDLMVPFDKLPLVRPNALMKDALIEMTGKNLGALVVVDENKNLQGIVTDGDLKRHMDDNLLKKSVSDIMSTSPKTIGWKALGAEALEIMTAKPGHYLSCLIVMDDNNLKGMIRLQDCLQAGLA